ncbi:hypothetical protein J6590_019400 [Homalodisca vitripennis]|nr:hypothetical protein J6590_019400 [Homalodisca vitripennis]
MHPNMRRVYITSVYKTAVSTGLDSALSTVTGNYSIMLLLDIPVTHYILLLIVNLEVEEYITSDYKTAVSTSLDSALSTLTLKWRNTLQVTRPLSAPASTKLCQRSLAVNYFCRLQYNAAARHPGEETHEPPFLQGLGEQDTRPATHMAVHQTWAIPPLTITPLTATLPALAITAVMSIKQEPDWKVGMSGAGRAEAAIGRESINRSALRVRAGGTARLQK